MRKRLQNMLIELGITPNLTGFDYICDMVEAISEDKERTFQITQLYKKVGEKHGKNWPMVERAIRHAISKAKTDSGAWGEIHCHDRQDKFHRALHSCYEVKRGGFRQ